MNRDVIALLIGAVLVMIFAVFVAWTTKIQFEKCEKVVDGQYQLIEKYRDDLQCCMSTLEDGTRL